MNIALHDNILQAFRNEMANDDKKDYKNQSWWGALLCETDVWNQAVTW